MTKPALTSDEAVAVNTVNRFLAWAGGILGALMAAGMIYLVNASVGNSAALAVVAEQVTGIREGLNDLRGDRWRRTEHDAFASHIQSILDDLKARQGDVESRLRNLERNHP